jgi:hypothetical protein
MRVAVISDMHGNNVAFGAIEIDMQGLIKSSASGMLFKAGRNLRRLCNAYAD